MTRPDFAGFDQPAPLLFNLVRHPVDRLVSWHYYVRDAAYIVDRHRAFPGQALPRSAWVRKTFDQCVADPDDQECKYPQVLNFFIPNLSSFRILLDALWGFSGS